LPRSTWQEQIRLVARLHPVAEYVSHASSRSVAYTFS
jgi:hypothetical protein